MTREQVRAFATDVGLGGLVYKTLHARPVAEENEVAMPVRAIICSST
jgi:hypothetical protein